LLDNAELQRHHVVLDLNAGSGLLTWEVLRRAPEGGTWALARDRTAGEGLRQQAERLPALARPTILVGDMEELPELLELRGEGELRFDAAVGRNALGSLVDKAGALRLVAGRLRPGGRLSLAETVVREAQRLYDLVDLSVLDPDLRRRLVESEEAIYADPEDPLVNWTAEDLRGAVEAAGYRDVHLEEEVQEGEMLVTASTLDRWFGPDPDAGRPSYASRLLRHLSAGELSEVEGLFRRQLGGQAVPWRSYQAYLTGQCPDN